MPDFAALSGELEKREQDEQSKLISGLQDLPTMTERGEIKATYFATIDCDNDSASAGILRGQNTALLEMIGLAQIS
ncbi:hypothetical protein HYPGJ_20110 [Hyphomicrobium sp. GJ21]|uniref:hypothetical protein n=1 Tax=Hyphomicrobium sp. GJ21 TaxID=113574 RepID=UPI000622B82A|nr:hypothetical protein [Hyphomicrobium sp. GJ21]CEJ84144.1 hypothetical protein HYPGJ_20110 [Hyphomicrobium sp. GJ21]